MGRSSKELKEIKEKTGEKAGPIANKDYYIIRANTGDRVPAGWIYSAYSRNALSKERVILQLALFNSTGVIQQTLVCGPPRWFLFPGPKPDKKWGPVCP